MLIVPILRRVLDKFNLFLMQSNADAEKIISLGASKDRVRITGNLKYDAAFLKGVEQKPNPAELRKRFGLGEEDKLFIAGSTHNGEEKIILRCYKELVKEHPQLRLLIAPRRIERANDIVKLAKGQGFDAVLISQTEDLRKQIRQDEILILDVMGMLSGVYSIGEVIFIGGSLVRKGGHNPLEAAYHSKAIIFGPHTHNFKDITEELLSNQASIEVKDEMELKNSIIRLLDNQDERKAIGEKAKATSYSNIGVVKRDLEFIEAVIF